VEVAHYCFEFLKWVTDSKISIAESKCNQIGDFQQVTCQVLKCCHTLAEVNILSRLITIGHDNLDTSTYATATDLVRQSNMCSVDVDAVVRSTLYRPVMCPVSIKCSPRGLDACWSTSAEGLQPTGNVGVSKPRE